MCVCRPFSLSFLQLLDDGRVVAVIEGVERFYVEQILAEKPYIKAKVCMLLPPRPSCARATHVCSHILLCACVQVQVFTDYTEEKNEYLDAMENSIFEKVRLNLKFMKLLYPAKKFSLDSHLVRYRPPSMTSGIRSVRIMDEAAELDRRTKFSFAVTEMLSIAAPTKLVLMQDHRVEQRYARSLRILERGGDFLREEIKKKNIVTEEGLARLQRDLLQDRGDVDEIIAPADSWHADNFVDGGWQMRPILF